MSVRVSKYNIFLPLSLLRFFLLPHSSPFQILNLPTTSASTEDPLTSLSHQQKADQWGLNCPSTVLRYRPLIDTLEEFSEASKAGISRNDRAKQELKVDLRLLEEEERKLGEEFKIEPVEEVQETKLG